MNKDLQLASLWDEWLSSCVKSRTSADYEASGLLFGMKHTRTAFKTNRLRAARRLTGPCRTPLWSLTSYAEKFPLTISMSTTPAHRPSIRFTCPEKILRLPKNQHTSWLWLKGIWGSAGSLYFPKAGYCLTLTISDPAVSEIAKTAMNFTGLSWTEHRYEFMLRSHDDIMTFLCNAGMPSGALEFDGISLMRSMKMRAVRESNYDNANIRRSLEASRKQLITAEKIISSGLFGKLTEKQRELVTMRIAYPDETLSGLGKRLTPKITKAAVKSRWLQIQSMPELSE